MKKLLIPVLTLAVFFTACTEDDCKTCEQYKLHEAGGEFVSDETTSLGTLCGVNLSDLENSEPTVEIDSIGGFETTITTTITCN